MNIGDELKAAAQAAVPDDTSDDARSYVAKLEAEYRRRLSEPDQRRLLDEAPAVTLLAHTAYVLGVHYAVREHPEAQQWLRIAAECDVGDSAFRLADLFEAQAVRKFNNQMLEENACEPGEEQFAAAHYWYGQATAAGYSRGNPLHPLELDSPLLPLDCCSPVEEKAAEERAVRILAEARQDAAAILRDARADVNVVIECARREVDELARRRERIAGELGQLRDVLHGIASITGKRRRFRPEGQRGFLSFRRKGKSSVVAPQGLGFEVEGSTKILDDARDTLTSQRGRTWFRMKVSRILTSFEVALGNTAGEPTWAPIRQGTAASVPSQPNESRSPEDQAQLSWASAM